MFKKMVLGLAAASMVATPMIAAEASAQGRRTVTTVQHYGPHGGYTERTVVRRQNAQRTPTYRNWHRGERFDRSYARNYRQIAYRTYRGRGLYAPPRGYQWVQSGNDAVLVALASGLIGAVIGGAIR